jgi:phosphatidate cytidylyltransferase
VLRQRLLTGSILIASLLLALWADGPASRAIPADALPWWTGGREGIVVAALGILLLAPLMGRELAAMLRGAGIAAPTWLTVLAAVAGAAAVRVAAVAPGTGASAAILAGTAWAVLALALVVHTRGQQVPGAMAATAGTVLAFTYLGLMLGCWMLVRNLIGPWGLAGAVLTVKASDMGAYFTGMAIGRHKMIPWLSPAKSWEGLAGGIAASAAVGGVLAWLAAGSLPECHALTVPVGIGVGLAAGLLGPFGDLAESLFKRNAAMKDSGSVLPGMGGALDVLDSPLLAGPGVLAILMFAGIGSLPCGGTP